MPEYAYTTVTGKVKPLLEKIRTVGVPPKVTDAWLKSLALQLHSLLTSESMDHHDSEDHGWQEHRLRRRSSFGRRHCGM